MTTSQAVMSSIWWSWGAAWLHIVGNDYNYRGTLCIDYTSVGEKPEESRRDITNTCKT